MVKMDIPQSEIIEVLRKHGYSDPEMITSHENVMKVSSLEYASGDPVNTGSVGSYYDAEKGDILIARCISLTTISIYERLKAADISGIPHIYDVLTCDGFGLVIEECISGRDLGRLIEEDGGYLRNITNIDHIVSSLVDILEELGDMNPPIIHRDIKPANIMLDDDKNVYLIDFNISREHDGSKIHDTVAMGTRGFAAPEQYGFSESDIRTDFYGLGATVRYILDNVKAYQTFLPDVEREKVLRTFADKCTMLDKKDRFENAFEIKKYLGYDTKTRKSRNADIETNNRNNVKRKKNGSSGEHSSYSNHSKKDGYTLPGFRSGNPLNMVIALVGYFLAGYFAYQLMFLDYKGFDGMKEKYKTPFNAFSAVYTFIVFLIVIFFAADYRGVQSRITFLNKAKSKNEYAVRVGIAATILMLLLLFLEGMIVVSVEKFLE